MYTENRNGLPELETSLRLNGDEWDIWEKNADLVNDCAGCYRTTVNSLWEEHDFLYTTGAVAWMILLKLN